MFSLCSHSFTPPLLTHCLSQQSMVLCLTHSFSWSISHSSPLANRFLFHAFPLSLALSHTLAVSPTVSFFHLPLTKSFSHVLVSLSRIAPISLVVSLICSLPLIQDLSLSHSFRFISLIVFLSHSLSPSFILVLTRCLSFLLVVSLTHCLSHSFSMSHTHCLAHSSPIWLFVSLVYSPSLTRSLFHSLFVSLTLTLVVLSLTLSPPPHFVR